MTVKEVMKELEAMGSESTKKIFIKHGAVEPFFGVKVGDLKKIQKKIKKDHELSLQLYDTGNSDAMYLAGLIADESIISKKELDQWAKKAPWNIISEYAVAWLAAETPHAIVLANKWIKAKSEAVASAGWATWSSYISITSEDDLDVKAIKAMIDQIGETIHDQSNRVRYTMNGFVIAAGAYIPSLTKYAIATGEKIGKVEVNVGQTACKVPVIKAYLDKMKKANRIGKTRKMARC